MPSTVTPASTFKNSLSITHIGTATAVINIDGITFLTDPFFSPAGSEWDSVPGAPKLKVHHDPALKMDQLPPIDAVLLSHENHPDNLDELGRRLLDGRHVFTTKDGARNLSPRPGVLGFDDWEEKDVVIAGTTFHITATPCKHWPGHECVGFVVHTESFGISVDGKPNAIYFSGDTVYIEELAKIADKYHIAVAILNCGEATFENFDAKGQPSQTGSSIQITMGGHQAAHLFRDIKADVLVPMHYDAWDHFKQKEEGLSAEFREEGIMSRVCWLQPGKAVLIDPST